MVIVIAFSAGVQLEGRRLALAFAIGAVLAAAGVLVDPAQNQDGAFLFAPVFTIGAPMLFGQLLRNRTRLNLALRERAWRDERGRAAEAEAAAQQERTRIASELHDVVAHALSAMTVQAGAARRLSDRDPARAADAFAAVEGTGREALTELRRLLGVLRKEDEELALAPQPSLANVDGLTRRATASGLPVELTVHGAARPLPAGVDLTAYRVVQEALNHARDAGFAGRATVEIGYGDEHISLDVRDDGAAEGRRLLGTRERVAVYGGELASAPLAGGGWRVAARLPAAGVGMIARLRSLPDRAWDFALTTVLLFFLCGDVVSGSFDDTAFVPCFACVLVISLLPLGAPPRAAGDDLRVDDRDRRPRLGLRGRRQLHRPDPRAVHLPYNAGLRAPGRRGFAALPAIWVTAAAAALTDPSVVWGDLVFPGVFGTLFWVVGRTIASRSHLTAELHEAALRAGEELELDATRAVAEERRRIAREMHDVVAHSVSMMVVQAGGARRILDRDPERAIAAAELIERTGATRSPRCAVSSACCTPTSRPATRRSRRSPSSTGSSSAPGRRACRSRSRSAASGRSSPPGSTSPRTGCCRRRSRT